MGFSGVLRARKECCREIFAPEWQVTEQFIGSLSNAADLSGYCRPVRRNHLPIDQAVCEVHLGGD
jgi:hypothetical protein